jgi:hypothetical protein
MDIEILIKRNIAINKQIKELQKEVEDNRQKIRQIVNHEAI